MGYPKGTKGYLFYDLQKQWMIVSTNTCFLKENYMMKDKVKNILDELRAESTVPSYPHS